MHCLANETMYKLNIARVHRQLPGLRAATLTTRKIGAIGADPCRFYRMGSVLVFVSDARLKITNLQNQCLLDVVAAQDDPARCPPESNLPSTFRYGAAAAAATASLGRRT
ncbi:hypothetical protein H4R18_003005 [Coemansia javaensis]|uniref:Uncharacterized protein n=1 Tax=Coemansia javaensis TaxID=2761396 RepID=A0A9W8LJ31_9FUNG|nr:hypothetical protein H4R18_003005 [Coemansia javaensis]